MALLRPLAIVMLVGCGARSDLGEPEADAGSVTDAPALDVAVEGASVVDARADVVVGDASLDADADADAAVDAGIDAGCPMGFISCNSICVDPNSDPKNCGGCNIVCGMNTACVAGMCLSIVAQQGRIAVGANHACGIDNNKTVKCWGANASGQLGDGTTTDHLTATASKLANATTVSAGTRHTCGFASGVFCWGSNTQGELGDGTTTARTTPFGVTLANADSASAGSYATCAHVAGGSLACWGANAFGELGDGTYTQRLSPTAVSGITTATSVATSTGDHTCAVLQNGTVQCWGSNFWGELGDGTTTDRQTPVAVKGLSSAVAVAVGGSSSCAILMNGDVACWGNNWSGQLGNGVFGNTSSVPVMSKLSSAVAISLGYMHACALRSNGDVMCWGANIVGQLGDGTTQQRTTPVQAASGAIAVAAGDENSCAMLATGQAQCWGHNRHGEVGDGTTTQRVKPTLVSGF